MLIAVINVVDGLIFILFSYLLISTSLKYTQIKYFKLEIINTFIEYFIQPTSLFLKKIKIDTKILFINSLFKTLNSE